MVYLFSVRGSVLNEFEQNGKNRIGPNADILRLLWLASFHNPEFRADIFSSSHSKVQSLMPLARLRIS